MKPPTRILMVALTFVLAAATPLESTSQAKRPRKTSSTAGRSDLLRLLKRRPRGMAVDVWREQRREVARELGRLKERRAVPVLLSIVEKERFDVILEIAIDALGNIGDKRAVAPLQRLLNDPSLDGYVRDAVAGALKKLEGRDSGSPRPIGPPEPQPSGRDNDGGPSSTEPTSAGTPDIAARLAQGAGSRGAFTKLPALPPLQAETDLLARSEQLDLVLGSADISWDGAAETTSTAVAVGTRYRRQLEQRQVGYTLAGAADLGFRLNDPSGADSTTWGLEHALAGSAEARYYPFQRDLPQFFGQVIGGASYGVNWVSPAGSLERRITFGSTLSVGAGPGYGRIVDVGSRLRLERLERVLRKAGLLEDELSDQVAQRLMHTWFALRNKVGSYAQLGYTLRVLRRANLLLREADAATIYRAIRILDDSQLFDRRSGIMFRLGYGYARDLLLDADDRNHGMLYATAEWRHQLGTIRQVGASLQLFWDHMADPNSINAKLQGGYDWFLYNRAFDPLGALGVTAELGLAKPAGAAFADSGMAYRALVGGAYTRFFSRGTRIKASIQGGAERQGGLIMLSVEATYGVAQGAYVIR